MSASDELLAWVNGSATGGPELDGRYPLTDTEGVVHLVYCPAALALNPALQQQPIEVFSITASNAAAAALVSENAAAASALSANSAATTAVSAKNSATASELKAAAWAERAVNVTVEPGAYSAKHWATKAQQSAASLASPTWGSITGTITDQLDLVAYINQAVSSVGGSGISTGEFPPSNPTPGMRWVDAGGIEYTYLEDANSGQWVELGPYNIGASEVVVVDGGTYE